MCEQLREELNSRDRGLEEISSARKRATRWWGKSVWKMKKKILLQLKQGRPGSRLGDLGGGVGPRLRNLSINSWLRNSAFCHDDNVIMAWRNDDDDLMMLLWCHNDIIMMTWWCHHNVIMMLWWCMIMSLRYHNDIIVTAMLYTLFTADAPFCRIVYLLILYSFCLFVCLRLSGDLSARLCLSISFCLSICYVMVSSVLWMCTE